MKITNLLILLLTSSSASIAGLEHYGWNCREGNIPYSGGSVVCDNGYVYRGAIVGLQGLYVYTNAI